jgi:hypothetical protein
VGETSAFEETSMNTEIFTTIVTAPDGTKVKKKFAFEIQMGAIKQDAAQRAFDNQNGESRLLNGRISCRLEN